ncbi:hypothetical protein GPECTOR_1g580 [Gonium pectorale]|uniref:Anaphase-promoting complex subunit 4 WD40 domain-containing protein n=1 Tax=Gonium pectorale TaxID=33097 RepID=A0A150H3M0_GONPE|nr:hypothetical protein GPECTOR_1g580 [Gonium pectorale]|eukprot:KXZ56644.1 hypothetical protein GPECTOR_1g580 [Gonium pectorale]
MGKKGSASPGPTNTFKYGMPLYGLAWPEGATFFLCGGGGHGIKNRLVCAEAHRGVLTDQTAEYLFGTDCPTRLAVTPSGKSIVFAMGNGGIRRLDLDTRGKMPRFSEVTGSLEERLKSITTDVKVMSFHPSGDYLALGGDDGSVVVGDRKLSDETIKDLDFVPWAGPGAAGQAGSRAAGNGKALMVILDNGSAAVVDLDRGGHVLCRAQLAKGMENANFSRVRCRTHEGERATLVCLMNNRSGCHVGLWELGDDGLLSMRAACKVADGPGACMDASSDGVLVAVGTSEGDVALVGSRPHLRVIKRFPKAHMVFTTNIAFNHDASYVLSTSADASATVNATALPPPPDFKRILALLLIFVSLLLLILLQTVRVLKQRGMSLGEIYEMVGLRRRDEL